MILTRIVMAYDGSAAATAALAWMQDGTALEVVTLTLDLGQRDELDAVRERALAAGAARAHVLDVRESFARDHLLPALRAGAACDDDGRPVGRALSRPLIARQLVEVARMEGATVVAHGGWRDAVDRARIETALRLLAPDLIVRAPLVEWDASEDEVQAFAEARGLRLPRIARGSGDAGVSESGTEGVTAGVTRVAANLWGRCVYLDDLADGTAAEGTAAEGDAAEGDAAEGDVDGDDASGASPAAGVDAGRYAWTKAPDAAPETPAFVDVEFERGTPVGISGVTMSPLETISSLETIAGAHGVGRVDLTREGRGHHRSLASRVLTGSVDDLDDVGDLCEAPAATVLVVAHAALERAVLPEDVAAPHAKVRGWYRDLVRAGAWTGLPREACQAFIDRTQERVTGSVHLALSRGTCRVVRVDVRETPASSPAPAAHRAH